MTPKDPNEDTGIHDIRALTGGKVTPLEAMYIRLKEDLRSTPPAKNGYWWKTLLPIIITLVLAAGGITWSLARTSEKVETIADDVGEVKADVKEQGAMIRSNSMRLERISGALEGKRP